MVGHAVYNDLQSLQLIHRTIVDTAYYYRNPVTNQQVNLRRLAQEQLEIQMRPEISSVQGILYQKIRQTFII